MKEQQRNEMVQGSDDLASYITARCSNKVRDRLAELAKADKRSLSNYIRIVLEEHVEKCPPVEQAALFS